jgi:hypothetical protein
MTFCSCPPAYLRGSPNDKAMIQKPTHDMLCFFATYDKEDAMDRSLIEKQDYGNWVSGVKITVYGWNDRYSAWREVNFLP